MKQFGTTYESIQLATGERVAAKAIENKEVRIMKQMKLPIAAADRAEGGGDNEAAGGRAEGGGDNEAAVGPSNVVQFIDVFEDTDFVYILHGVSAVALAGTSDTIAATSCMSSAWSECIVAEYDASSHVIPTALPSFLRFLPPPSLFYIDCSPFLPSPAPPDCSSPLLHPLPHPLTPPLPSSMAESPLWLIVACYLLHPVASPRPLHPTRPHPHHPHPHPHPPSPSTLHSPSTPPSPSPSPSPCPPPPSPTPPFCTSGVVRQMLSVVAKCHLHGVVHRDLKPENFLFKSKAEDALLKATDFGLSDFRKPGKHFTDVVGSAYYVAPEVLKRRSGPESDVWSIGVITYILLSGRRPFWDRTEAGIFNEVLKKRPDFREKPWPNVSSSAKDFVKKLLKKDPRARPTAAQALSHKWVKEGGDASSVPLDIAVLSNMREFVKYSRLKQMALKALATTLEENEVQALRDQFNAMDINKDGTITIDEIRQALSHDLPFEVKESRVLQILQAMDTNCDGIIDFDEFVAATLHVQQLEEADSTKWQERSRAAFAQFDRDNDGYIDAEELRMAAQVNFPLDNLIAEADTDGDGRISLPEQVAAKARESLTGPAAVAMAASVSRSASAAPLICHAHAHSHDHSHSHGHHHHHHHCCPSPTTLNAAQRALLSLFSFLRLAPLADRMRESAPLASLSLALCLAAYAVPLLVPLVVQMQSQPLVVQMLQTGLVAAAFPLTAIPATMDALVDIAGGAVNIHVLMTVAALASAAMGNALEGTLLLAMFSISHIAEHYFTEKALGDLRSLQDNNPSTALLIDPSCLSSVGASTAAAASENGASGGSNSSISNGSSNGSSSSSSSSSSGGGDGGSERREGGVVFPGLAALSWSEVPVADVPVGAMVLVKAGEVVPLDGTVRFGRSLVTTEHLTGEAHPVEKLPGNTLPGGSRTIDGFLVVETSRKWSESTVARIMQLTEQARSQKPPLQRWLDKFSEKYSQAVVGLSVGVAVLGPLLFGWPLLSSPGVRGSLYRALAVMVAASPCALAVAPLAYFCALTACAAKGILLKGGHALDATAACDTVAFDKTGTLTTGQLALRFIQPLHSHAPHTTPSLLTPSSPVPPSDSTPSSPSSSTSSPFSSSSSSASSSSSSPNFVESEKFWEDCAMEGTGGVRRHSHEWEESFESTQKSPGVRRHSHEWEETGVVVECSSASCEAEALAVAAALEQAATHPIARALREYADSRRATLTGVSVDQLQLVPGRGLTATISSLPGESDRWGPHEARIGSLDFIAEVAEDRWASRAAAGTVQGGDGFDRDKAARASGAAAADTPSVSQSNPPPPPTLPPSDLIRAALAVGQKVTLFHFEDQLRPGAKEVVRQLQQQGGLRVQMLTGDHAASAHRVAAAVGIEGGEVEAGLRPEDKLRAVEEMTGRMGREGRGGVLMVGDGINDAPALAAATVGVVLAERASATAVAAADVLLLKDNISELPFLVAKARQTTLIVKQSVALALTCILLALLPALLGHMPLWLTVLLHEGGTLLVCLNSIRALNPAPLRRPGLTSRLLQRAQLLLQRLVGQQDASTIGNGAAAKGGVPTAGTP
ncbi:unnamed protein product [Closterium sp. NIES-64]|nr:unnamed protein product [Closterium sp. NIES-64]